MITPTPEMPIRVMVEPPLRPGANLRLGRNRLGAWFDGPGSTGDWRHPWLVTVSGKSVRVAPGLLLAETAVEPRINGAVLSGGPGGQVPVLTLDDGAINLSDESYVCLEVTPTAEGKLTDQDGTLLDAVRIEVVERPSPYLHSGDVGRTPLAMIFHGAGTPRVTQVAMFHLRYETNQAEGQQRRHYFR